MWAAQTVVNIAQLTSREALWNSGKVPQHSQLCLECSPYWGQASSCKQSRCGRHGLSNILKQCSCIHFITDEQVKLTLILDVPLRIIWENKSWHNAFACKEKCQTFVENLCFISIRWSPYGRREGILSFVWEWRIRRGWPLPTWTPLQELFWGFHTLVSLCLSYLYVLSTHPTHTHTIRSPKAIWWNLPCSENDKRLQLVWWDRL